MHWKRGTAAADFPLVADSDKSSGCIPRLCIATDQLWGVVMDNQYRCNRRIAKRDRTYRTSQAASEPKCLSSRPDQHQSRRKKRKLAQNAQVTGWHSCVDGSLSGNKTIRSAHMFERRSFAEKVPSSRVVRLLSLSALKERVCFKRVNRGDGHAVEHCVLRFER